MRVRKIGNRAYGAVDASWDMVFNYAIEVGPFTFYVYRRVGQLLPRIGR